MAKPNKPLPKNSEIIQNCLGKKIDSDIDVYHLLGDPWLAKEKIKTLVAFLDKEQKVCDAIIYDDQESHVLNKDVLIKKAIRSESDRLAIVTAYGEFPDEKMPYCTGPSSPSMISNALKDPERLIPTIRLAQDLQKSGITMSEIILSQRSSFTRYSDVSKAVFPGFERKSYREFDGKTVFNAKNRDKICDRIIHIGARHSQDDVYAIFLDEKKNVTGSCEVLPLHGRLIKGVLEEKEYLFDSVFREAIQQEAASIVMVQHIPDRSEKDFVANAEDCKVFHTARDKAALYNIPLDDYLLYVNESLPAPYSTHYRHKKTLSFTEHYGLK